LGSGAAALRRPRRSSDF